MPEGILTDDRVEARISIGKVQLNIFRKLLGEVLSGWAKACSLAYGF